jgi:hypothetical protein
VLRRLIWGQGEIPRGAQRFRTIWWTFDYRHPAQRNRIFMGVGMAKIEFARRVAEILGVEEVSWVYRDVYGGAWWRITEPVLIGVAHENYGRVVSFDDKEKEVVEVF